MPGRAVRDLRGKEPAESSYGRRKIARVISRGYRLPPSPERAPQTVPHPTRNPTLRDHSSPNRGVPRYRKPHRPDGPHPTRPGIMRSACRLRRQSRHNPSPTNSSGRGADSSTKASATTSSTPAETNGRAAAAAAATESPGPNREGMLVLKVGYEGMMRLGRQMVCGDSWSWRVVAEVGRFCQVS